MNRSRVRATNDIRTHSKRAQERTRIAVGKALFDIKGGAMQRSRVDTGAMKNGWSVRMLGPFSGQVYNPFEHAIYNEFGTVKMSAQPMARPAAIRVWPSFQKAVAQAYAEG